MWRRGLRGRRKDCCWRRRVEAALSGYRRGRRSPSDRGSGGCEVAAGGGVEAVQALLVESERDGLVEGEARVHHVENHGVELVVTLSAGDALFKATAPATTRLTIDETVPFTLNQKRLHGFDATTGRNLASAA